MAELKLLARTRTFLRNYLVFNMHPYLTSLKNVFCQLGRHSIRRLYRRGSWHKFVVDKHCVSPIEAGSGLAAGADRERLWEEARQIAATRTGFAARCHIF